MKIFFDRSHSFIQLISELKNQNEFTKLRVYKGTVDPTVSSQESILLTETAVAPILFFPFSFSFQQTGNIYLVGVLADNNVRLISSVPISSGVHFNAVYTNAVRGLNTRKFWYSRLRSERDAKIFFKSISQTCTCFDPDFKQPYSGCPICKGTGTINGYVGAVFDVMIENDVKKVKIQEPSGRKVSVDALQGWIFQFPFVNDECIIERANGDRYTINNVSYQYFGGELVEMSFNLILLPDWFDYKFTLFPTGGVNGN